MKKGSIIAIVIALIVLLGGGVAAYFSVIDTPKNLYLKSELKASEDMQKYLEKRFEKGMKFQEKMKDESYVADMKLGVDVPQSLADSFGIEKSVIDSSGFDMTIGTDPKAKKSLITLDPTIGGQSLGAFNWSADNKNQYISSPLFADVLSVPNDKIVQTFEKITGEKAPEEFTNESMNLNSVMNSSQLTTQDLNKMMERYSKTVVNNLDDKRFTKEKVSEKIFGEDKNVQKVTMDLTSADVKKMTLAILKEAKNDKDLEKLISDPSINMKKEIEKLIKDAEKEEEKSYPTIKSIIFLDGKDIVKRDLTVDSGNQEKEGIHLVGSTKLDDNIKVDYKLGSLASDTSEEATLKGESKKEKDSFKDKYNLTIGSDVKVAFDNTSEIDGDKNTDTGKFTFDVPTFGEPIMLNYMNKLTTDLKNNTQNQDLNITFDVMDDKVGINVTSEAKLKADIKVKADGAKDLSTMSDSNLQKLEEEINKNGEELSEQLAENLQ